MSQIHSTAIVADGASLGANVEIGAYTVVGSNVVLGDGVKLHAHVVIDGWTTIGAKTEIYPGAVIGMAPQHLLYKGEASTLVIGQGNIIREHVTMHPGTHVDKMTTVVGDNGYFMAGSHVSHDSTIGDHVIFANNATIGGHCTVGNHVIMGGLAGVHQRVRIGDFAFVGGASAVENDVVPFTSALGNRAYLGGLNIVGLKRNGFSREDIHALRQAYREIFLDPEGTLKERVAAAAKTFEGQEAVGRLIGFMQSEQERKYVTPRTGNGGG